jgi:hypothetical protein
MTIEDDAVHNNSCNVTLSKYSRVKALRSSGSEPEKSLENKLALCSAVKLERDAGNEPTKRLRDASKFESAAVGRLGHSSPEKPLSAMLIELSHKSATTAYLCVINNASGS